jgi:hypothetical protein
MINLLRQVFSANISANDAVVIDDVVPRKLNTVEELTELNSTLSTKEQRKKMVRR